MAITPAARSRACQAIPRVGRQGSGGGSPSLLWILFKIAVDMDAAWTGRYGPEERASRASERGFSMSRDGETTIASFGGAAIGTMS